LVKCILSTLLNLARLASTLVLQHDLIFLVKRKCRRITAQNLLQHRILLVQRHKLFFKSFLLSPGHRLECLFIHFFLFLLLEFDLETRSTASLHVSLDNLVLFLYTECVDVRLFKYFS